MLILASIPSARENRCVVFAVVDSQEEFIDTKCHNYRHAQTILTLLVTEVQMTLNLHCDLDLGGQVRAQIDLDLKGQVIVIKNNLEF